MMLYVQGWHMQPYATKCLVCVHGSRMTMKFHCALLWQRFRWISSFSWADEEASSGRLRHRSISILMNFHTVLIFKLNTCLVLPLRCFCAPSLSLPLSFCFRTFFLSSPPSPLSLSLLSQVFNFCLSCLLP